MGWGLHLQQELITVLAELSCLGTCKQGQGSLPARLPPGRCARGVQKERRLGRDFAPRYQLWGSPGMPSCCCLLAPSPPLALAPVGSVGWGAAGKACWGLAERPRAKPCCTRSLGKEYTRGWSSAGD